MTTKFSLPILVSTLLIVFAGTTHAVESQESLTAEQILVKMESASNQIQDTELTIEHYDANGKLVRRELKAFKKPNKHRVKTTIIQGMERATIVVSDGEKHWSYSPDEQVVTVSKIKTEDVILPSVGVLHRFSSAEIIEKYRVELKGVEEVDERKIYVFRFILKPGKGGTITYDSFNVEGILPPIGFGDGIATYAVWRDTEPTRMLRQHTKLGVDVHTFSVLFSESHDGTRTTQRTVATNTEKFDDGILFPTEVVSYDASGKVSGKTVYTHIRFNSGIADERFVFVPPTDAILLDEQSFSKRDETILQLEKKVKAEPEKAALRYALLQLYQRGPYPQNRQNSLKHLKKLVALKPDVAELHSRLGSAYLVANRAKESLAAFQKALALNPDLKLSHSLAQAYDIAGQKEKAIEQYKLTLETQTPGIIGFDYAREHVAERLVQLVQNRGNLAELIQETQTKLEAHPDNLYFHKLMGDAYAASQEKEKAIAEYRKLLAKMLEISPRRGYETQTYQELFGLYVKKKDVQMLISTYEKFIEYRPTSIGQLYNVRESIGQAELVELIEKGLEESPENVTLYLLLSAAYSGAYYEQRDLNKAASMLEHAVELAPDDLKVQMAMAKLSVQRKAYDEALKAYQRAIELNPRQPYYRAHLAYVYNRQGDHEKAIQIAKEVVQEHPNDVASQGVLATVHLNAGMVEDAISQYEKAIELAGDATNTQFFHKCIARAYETIENYSKADAIYEKLDRAIQPHELVRIYKARGDMEKLIAYGLKVLRTSPARYQLREIVDALSDSGMVSELVAAFEKELQSDPENPEIYRALAQAYSHHRVRDTQKAIEMYEKVIELAPTDADATIQLGGLYSNQGMHDKAITVYEKAMRLQPERPYIYPSLARAYVSVGRNEDALKLADALKKRVGYDANAYMQLGEVYSACKLHDKAIEAYKKAIELAPGESWYRRRLTAAYEAAGKVEEADALYEKTTDSSRIYERMRAYQQRGDLDKLLEFVRQVMKSSVHEGMKRSAQSQLVRASQQQGKSGELITLLQEDIKERPDDTVSYKMLGQVYSRKNSRAEAIEMYEKVIELTPDDGDAYRELGQLYSRQRMHNEAISTYKKAIELKPDESYLYSSLARAYANTGQTDEILKLADALKERSRDGYSYSQLGEVYMAARLYDEAIEAYRKAVKLSPESHYRSRLAQAYEQAGKPEEAETMYEKTTDPDMLRQRMRTLSQQGNLETLLEIGKRILSSGAQPRQKRNTIQQLVQGYSRQNKLAELATVFQERLAENPQDASTYSALGQIYMRQRNQPKATEMYEKATILAPNDDDAQSNLGQLYQSQRMYQKAIAAYRKALKLQPGLTHLYSQMANAYASIGKADEALKLVDELKQHMRSQRFGGNQGFMQATLGDIYVAAKHYEEAIEAFKKAIELEPRNDRYFKDKLARAYEQAGKPDPATKIRKEADPGAAMVGKEAPAFTLKDLSGKTVSLSDFRGKVVLLDFWATWCGPCRQTIPHLEALHRKYKGQGLAVIGINHERDHDKVKEFAKGQISYVVLLDADEQFTQYHISGIPTAFYIDREGKIRYRDVGFGPGKEKLVERKVNEMLAGKEDPETVAEPVGKALEQEAKVLAFDNFDGKLSLDWEILHADPSHFSLTDKPGCLTITTQPGTFRNSNKKYKNLFLIECPAPGEDVQVTTDLTSFKPVAAFNKAGLVFYNDDDSFLRWNYTWQRSRRRFNVARETKGKPVGRGFNAPAEVENLWLRVTKRANRYTVSTSLDGKRFRDHGEFAWGDGSPKFVGLFAENGPGSKAPEIDAPFDFFEVRALPAKPPETADAAAKLVIPKENLQIPEEMQACAANLQEIHTAIKDYEEDKGRLPYWLSDLVPDYLSNGVLFCPSDTEHVAQYSPDPKLPCSYSWQFSAKDWKAQQIKLFGDVVPMVRCRHHGSERVLNLSVGGQIYWGRGSWEKMFIPDYTRGIELSRRPMREARPVLAKPAAAKYVIQKENLEIPEEMEGCTDNLKKNYAAIKKYEKDKGELPKWLSDLVSDYLNKEDLLCLNDPMHKAKYSPDPKLPCSYAWEFSSARIPSGWDPTRRTLYRDWKTQQVKLFGDVVPMVRCHHHGSNRVLNLSTGGQIYWGKLDWEKMFKADYRFGDESPRQQQREIQPARQLRIAGVARDEAGKPLAGVRLQALPMSRGEATSDSQGRFEIGWDPRRLGSRQTVHYLVARHERRNLAVAVEIEEETKTLDLKLKPGVTFTGEVVDPDGRGIDNARIMTMLRVSNWGSSLGRGRVVTNATGKFEVRAIPRDHKYSVTASAEGFGQNEIQIHADNAEYNHLDVGKLTLAVANLAVSGVVVDADDKPVAGARVYCYGEGQTPGSTQTDAEGKFTIEKICAGTIRISASVSGETRLSGYVQTDGGATDLKIVATERPSSVRYMPRPPLSLGNKPLPDLRDLGIELSPADATDKMILVCFWDMEQRPSRHCMRELIKQAEELKAKGVIVVAVQASQIDRGALDKWIKENNTPFPVGMIHEDAERVRLAWGVKSLPWLILTDRKHVIRVENFGLAELDEKIETVISQPVQELSAASDEWKPPENPDPQKILREAQADARAHRYEDALAKHVWFHRNALKYRPSLSGVRSSFALSYWSRLGKMYPPALVKLKEIRDEAEEDVKNGKDIRESFRDLRAINRTVGEESRTKDIFILLDAQNSDAAKRVFHYAQPALIKAKEYKLCGKYIDPERSFRRIIEGFRADRRLAENPRFGADHLEFANKKFTNDAATLVALLVVNGRKAEAEEIAGDAKKEWNNTSFHVEIDKALQGKLPKPWP